MNACISMYPVESPKTAFPHSEGSCLSGPWRSHWLQPSASSRAKKKQIIQDTILQISWSLKFKGMPSAVSILASSIQAGPSCNTSWPCFSCAASAGARMPVGHHGVRHCRICIYTFAYLYLHSLFHLYVMFSGSKMTGCLYLNEGGRRCRPVFVQNTLRQVFT